MKITVEVVDLNDSQWLEVDRMPVSMVIPEGMVPMCCTFVRRGGSEERHVQLTNGALLLFLSRMMAMDSGS